MFWKWMEEKHPVLHEVIWWAVDLMALAALILAVVGIVR